MVRDRSDPPHVVEATEAVGGFRYMGCTSRSLRPTEMLELQSAILNSPYCYIVAHGHYALLCFWYRISVHIKIDATFFGTER